MAPPITPGSGDSRDGRSLQAVPTPRSPNPEAIAAVRRILEENADLPSASQLEFSPVPGGVSGDLWRVSAIGVDGSWIAKQPRIQLRVAAQWQASTERALFEVRYLRQVRALLPDAVPEVLGIDVETRVFVMRDYQEPDWCSWEAQLLAGRVDPTVAHRLGSILGIVHARTAQTPELAEQFPTRSLFHALRIRPLFHAAGNAHPDLMPRLRVLEQDLAGGGGALIHGDAGPDNVLVGPAGRVLLIDAECAWWGSPHFDAAFLVTHLLLAWAHDGELARGLLTCTRTFLSAWLEALDRDADDALLERAVALIPALLLARVDGLVPLEYLSEERRGRLRSFARNQVRVAPATPELLLRRFERAMGDID